MSDLQAGFDVEDLRLPVKEALQWIAAQRLPLVEIPTAQGETAPRNLTASGRRHLARHVEGLGLRLASLTADPAGLQFTDPGAVEERVDRTCEAIDLARELRVPIVTSAVGALTHPESGALSEVGSAALRRIGEFADSRRVLFAIRPSRDSADRLQRVFAELACPSLRLALDPAATVMHGVNPLTLLDRLGHEVCLIHARDATAGLPGQPGHEAIFGDGEASWIVLAQALLELDYHGPNIARQCNSRDPRGDLAAAAERLTALFNR